MSAMRTLHHHRFASIQRGDRQAVAAGGADSNTRIGIRAAWHCRGCCRRIVIQRLKDLIAFVTGNPDLLAGIARPRNKVLFNGALRAATWAAVDVALLGFQNQGHSRSTRVAYQK